jgi:hypothetical protein
MRCREVSKAFTAYLDGEVTPSEHDLIQAHLAGCASCERELSTLSSSRQRVTSLLKTRAAQVAPSPQALSRLQASLAKQAHPEPQGDHRMKLRWRIALATAGAVVVAAGIIAAVPTTRAAAGEFFAHMFSIEADGGLQFEYLPAGFEQQPAYLVGSVSDPAQGEVAQQEQQAMYQNGDLFLLVKTTTDTSQALPTGEVAEVNGLPAVLRTGLSGTYDGPPAVLASGGDAAASGATPSVVTGESGLVLVEGPTGAVPGDGSLLPSVAYDNANSLTWDVDRTRVEILTNLPVEELLRIAQGLTLGN